MNHKKNNYYKQAIKKLEELHSLYPNYNIGRHLSIALSEYGDLWGLTDKELLFALTKYQAELELDSGTLENDEFVDQIVKDGMNLTSKNDSEDFEEDNWDD
jgi:hypothetical protein